MPNIIEASHVRIHNCAKSLENFAKTRRYPGREEENPLLNIIAAINHYYFRSWENAKTRNTRDNIAQSFECFMLALKDLNTEDNAYINRQLPTYLKHVDELQNRLFNQVIGHNIYNSLRIAFWASTAVTLSASVFLVVLPMLLVPTFFGIATAITIAGLLITAVAKAVEGFTDYRSPSRHKENKTNQKMMLNLFAPNRENDYPYDLDQDFQPADEEYESVPRD